MSALATLEGLCAAGGASKQSLDEIFNDAAREVATTGDPACFERLAKNGLVLSAALKDAIMRDAITVTMPADRSCRLVSLLLELGAEVCYVGTDQLTAVCLAVTAGRGDIVEILLTHTPSAVTFQSAPLYKTPLHCVVNPNRAETSSDVSTKVAGDYEYDMARWNNHRACSALCMEKNCNLVMTRLLFSLGANADAPDAHGRVAEICETGRNAVAVVMHKRITEFQGALAQAWHGRSEAPVNKVDVWCLFGVMADYLGWDTHSSTTKDNQAKFPHFPVKAPTGWLVVPYQPPIIMDLLNANNEGGAHDPIAIEDE